MMSGSRTPRDASKSADYYQAFVSREQQGIGSYTRYNNPALFFSVAPKCVRIGVALYSAGMEIAECHRWFAEAATYQFRFLSEGKQFKLGGPGNIDDYLELYSAAFLAGQSDQLIEALKRCSYTEAAHPAKVRLLAQFCDFLQGRVVRTSRDEVAELRSIKEDWAYLPVLFSSVSSGDVKQATVALDDYLLNSWGPATEKWAKKAVKGPDYIGKWTLLSTAACQIMSAVPELSAKAKTYLPIELVAARPLKSH